MCYDGKPFLVATVARKDQREVCLWTGGVNGMFGCLVYTVRKASSKSGEVTTDVESLQTHASFVAEEAHARQERE